MKIQSNDFTRQWEDIGLSILDAINNVGRSGWYILGTEVSSFEKNLSIHMRSPFSCGVANGLNALEIALRIIGIGKGHKVLTTPLSAFATTLAIINVGAKPIFCDTDINGNIDLNLVEEILSNESIDCFIPVHLYGNPLDLNHLLKISKKYDVPIIEDCAQAISASFDNKMVGSIGKLAGLSFYPTKNLGAMGDAGALLVKSQEDLSKAKSIRDYGQSQKYLHSDIGQNSRLDEIHAACLNFILNNKLGNWTQKRNEIANHYISQIQNKKLNFLKINEKSSPVWHLFPIFCTDINEKKSFIKYLHEKGIAATEHYPILITDQPCMKDIDHEIIGKLTNAKRIVETEVSIPIHPYLTEEEISYIIDEVNSW